MGHTEGPWKAMSGFVATTEPIPSVICKMSHICNVLNFAAEPGSIEDGANARLIAAATDLLAACKNAIALINSDVCHSPAVCRVIDICVAAVNKAERKN